MLLIALLEEIDVTYLSNTLDLMKLISLCIIARRELRINVLYIKRLILLFFNLYKLKRNIGFLSVLLESLVNLLNSIFILIRTMFKL
jgi:hypothetical protein